MVKKKVLIEDDEAWDLWMEDGDYPEIGRLSFDDLDDMSIDMGYDDMRDFINDNPLLIHHIAGFIQDNLKDWKDVVIYNRALDSLDGETQ